MHHMTGSDGATPRAGQGWPRMSVCMHVRLCLHHCGFTMQQHGTPLNTVVHACTGLPTTTCSIREDQQDDTE